MSSTSSACIFSTLYVDFPIMFTQHTNWICKQVRNLHLLTTVWQHIVRLYYRIQIPGHLVQYAVYFKVVCLHLKAMVTQHSSQTVGPVSDSNYCYWMIGSHIWLKAFTLDDENENISIFVWEMVILQNNSHLYSGVIWLWIFRKRTYITTIPVRSLTLLKCCKNCQMYGEKMYWS